MRKRKEYWDFIKRQKSYKVFRFTAIALFVVIILGVFRNLNFEFVEYLYPVTYIPSILIIMIGPIVLFVSGMATFTTLIEEKNKISTEKNKE